MPGRGSLGIVIGFNLLQCKARALGHVLDVSGTERLDRKQALARFKVAATQQKAELIDGRSQARGGLLDRRGEIEILLALETY